MTPAAAPTKVIERQVKRFVASCPIIDAPDGNVLKPCAFTKRTAPTLHATAAAAEVEAARHIRDVHRNRLSLGVIAKRRRQIVDETVELA
jgi:hypothetical protein